MLKVNLKVLPRLGENMDSNAFYLLYCLSCLFFRIIDFVSDLDLVFAGGIENSIGSCFTCSFFCCLFFSNSNTSGLKKFQ
jgi:hypothetical protein